MSQHDYNIANNDGASVRSDINDVLGAIVTWNSGSSDPATTFARMRAVNTTAGVVKRRNAANSGWIVESTDDETRVLSRSSNTMLDVSDIGKCIVATSTFTQTLDAAATLGDGWFCSYRIESGATITFDPNSSENIDGAATKAVVGPSSGLIFCNGSNLFTVGFPSAVTDAYPPKHISGLTYANGDGAGGGDATNDITVFAGSARDATDAVNMTLVASITKQLDAAWAVGSAAGGLDTGSIGNSDYYIWLIKRSDTGVVDVLFSLSATAPTMPANYDYRRLIGWFKRSGGAIVAFKSYELEGGGLEFLWVGARLDVDLSNTLTTSRRTDALSVPLDFSTVALLNVAIQDAGSTSNYISCPDVSDQAPSNTGAPLITVLNAAGGAYAAHPCVVRTGATGTIAARSNTATVDVYRVATLGFRWGRRN